MSSKFCTGCGGELASSAVFCSSCGKQRSIAVTAPAAVPGADTQPIATKAVHHADLEPTAPPSWSPSVAPQPAPSTPAAQRQPGGLRLQFGGVPPWLTTDWAPAAIIAALTAVGTLVLSAVLLGIASAAIADAELPVTTLATWVASIAFGASIKTIGEMDGQNVAFEMSILSLPLSIAPALISWLVARRMNLRVNHDAARPWLFPAKLGVACGAAAIVVTKMTSVTLGTDSDSFSSAGKVELLATSGRAFLITALFVTVLHRLTLGIPVGAQRLSPRLRSFAAALPDALLSFGACAAAVLVVGGGYALSQTDVPSEGYPSLAIGVLMLGITAGGLVATAAQGAPVEVNANMDSDGFAFSGTMFSAPIPGWMKLSLLIAPAVVAWVVNRGLQRRPVATQPELSQRVLSAGVMFGVVTFVFSMLSRLTMQLAGDTSDFGIDSGSIDLGVNSLAALVASSFWGLAGAAIAAHMWGKPRGIALISNGATTAPTS